MKTKDIKKFLKETFGLKMLSVTSGLSKNPFLSARIRPSVYAKPVVGAQNEYTEEFPVEFREMALKVIYGETWQSLPGRRGNAGNVNAHDIAMKETEWDKLIARWNASVNKEMVQVILDTVPTSDKVTA